MPCSSLLPHAGEAASVLQTLPAWQPGAGLQPVGEHWERGPQIASCQPPSPLTHSTTQRCQDLVLCSWAHQALPPLAACGKPSPERPPIRTLTPSPSSPSRTSRCGLWVGSLTSLCLLLSLLSLFPLPSSLSLHLPVTSSHPLLP